MVPLRLVGLFTLPFLQLTHAIAFPTPVPTAADYDDQNAGDSRPEMPKTTAGLNIGKGALRRRDPSVISTIEPYVTGDSSLCGWENGNLAGAYHEPSVPNNSNRPQTNVLSGVQIFCPTGSSCVFHYSNTAFPGMAGCCSGTNCAFETTCYDSSKIAATPSLTDPFDAFAIYCSDSTQGACVTWTYPGIAGGGVTDYGCDSTAYIMNLYTTGTHSYVTGSTDVISKIFVTTADDATISSYSSLYATSSSAPNHALASSGMYRTSSTPVTVTTSPASHPGSGSSSPSTGAIAGGVVGGVVGGAAIGAAAIFFFLQRRRKRNAADPSDLGQTGYQTGYQNGFANQSGHDSGRYTVEVQPPSEMMSSEPSHTFPEAEGSMLGSTAQEIDSNGFVAELSADHETR